MQGFRVHDHLKSFKDSSHHLDMPTFDEKELLGCIQELVKLDKDWINCLGEPDQLYARMTHFSMDKRLGVSTPQQTKMLVFLNPIQYSQKPLAVKCSYNVNRNWPLGHGTYRLSGNLGPLIPSVQDAKMNGFDDVLWLLDDYIKELTVLNFFVLQQSRYGNIELVTPPSDDGIMNGTMRKTILELKDKIQENFKCKVVDREISIHEVINSSKEGRLIEMFGAATHCPLQPVNRVVYRDSSMILDNIGKGSISAGINNLL